MLVDAAYVVVTEVATMDEELAGTVADAQLTRDERDELDYAVIRAGVIAPLMGEWQGLSEAQATCADQ